MMHFTTFSLASGPVSVGKLGLSTLGQLREGFFPGALPDKERGWWVCLGPVLPCPYTHTGRCRACRNMMSRKCGERQQKPKGFKVALRPSNLFSPGISCHGPRAESRREHSMKLGDRGGKREETMMSWVTLGSGNSDSCSISLPPSRPSSPSSNSHEIAQVRA